MKSYSLAHLSDRSLPGSLESLAAHDRGTTALLLAHIAEVESRRLYLPAGYPSMYAYCVGRLRMSEDVALKRIRAARCARRFPVIFTAIAEGRMHLTGVVILAPYLIEASAGELLESAMDKTKFEIEQLVANRFPRPDVPTLVQAIGRDPAACQLAPEPVGTVAMSRSLNAAPVCNPAAPEPAVTPAPQAAPDPQLAPEPVGTPVPAVASVATGALLNVAPWPKVTPIAPGRYGVQFTMGQSMHDKLQEAQDLLGHQVRRGDLPSVLERALDALIAKLEKAKFAATARPQSAARPSRADSRHIPAAVKREVRKRDGDRCTYVSDAGHRCEERRGLEYDHIAPYGRDGATTAANLRLRCRAHNQFDAEQAYGMSFMSSKREQARQARDERKLRAAAVSARA